MPKHSIHNRRMTLRLLGLFHIAILLVIPCSSNAGEELNAFLDRDAICDAWESTYGSIRTMRVKYTTEQVSSGPNRAAKTIRKNVERIEQGKLHYTAYSYGTDSNVDSENPIIASFDGINSCEYITKHKRGSIDPGLSAKATDMMNEVKIAMLMYDTLSFSGDQAKESSSIPRFLFYVKSGNAQVGEKLEYVAGEACHVITMIHKSEEYNADTEIKLWVAHNKGMLLLKQETHDYTKDINCVMEVSEIACSEPETGKVWYPRKLHSKMERPQGTTERTVVTEEFEPNINIDKSAFKVVFPTGARVTDNVMGITYVVGGENIQVDMGTSASQDKQKANDNESVDNSQVVHDSHVEQSKNQDGVSTIGLVDNESMFGFSPKNRYLMVFAGAILLFVIVIMGVLLLRSHSKSTKQGGV